MADTLFTLSPYGDSQTQCEGWTYKGVRCTRMLKQTKVGNRLVLCRPHERQRAGHFRLYCVNAWACHSYLIIHGRKKFMDALVNRPTCHVCEHFAEEDKQEVDALLASDEVRDLDTLVTRSAREEGARDKMRALILETLGSS